MAELDAEAQDDIDAALAAQLTPELLTEVLALVPDGWLIGMNAAQGDPRDAQAWRERYREYLLARLENRSTWRAEMTR